MVLWHTEQTHLELEASGAWSRRALLGTLGPLVRAEAAAAWEQAIARVPPGPIVRVTPTVDLRTDTFAVHVTMRIVEQSGDDVPAQILSLATHMGLPEPVGQSLAADQQAMARAGAVPEVQLTLVRDGLRPWLGLRFVVAPEVASLVRGRYGLGKALPDGLDDASEVELFVRGASDGGLVVQVQPVA